MKFFYNNCTIYYLIFAITIVGGFFRFYNLNWDQGYFFHPDERNIAVAVSKIHFFDQLNPEFFAYGSFPIYLYRSIGDILTIITKNPNWISEWGYINLIGRAASAFFSTLTIVLIFVVGIRLFNQKVGLLAALFSALTVFFVQTAHYSVTESLLIFWLMLIILSSLNIAHKPTIENYLKAGALLGLAMATKIAALSFFIIPLVAHFLSYSQSLKKHLKLLILLATMFLIFTVLSPYAFLDHQKFLESMKYESGVATGALKVVYTLQFEKTLPYVFQIKNLFWELGPLAFWGIVGWITLLIFALKRKEKKLFLILSFPFAYFFYAGSWHTKFIRYMAPLLPFLNLFAAWLLIEIWNRHKKIGLSLISLTTLATLIWSMAFFSIYTKESTRITASNWIYENIPAGSKILTEHWDDGLPLDFPDNHPNQYQIEQLTLYDEDNYRKILYYAGKLSDADYIIINSRRLYGTLINLPEKYPITSKYYKLLFANELGYHKVAEFSSYPQIFGIEINDDSSEETFQVYDHPKVIIFGIKRRSSENKIKNLLRAYDK